MSCAHSCGAFLREGLRNPLLHFCGWKGERGKYLAEKGRKYGVGKSLYTEKTATVLRGSAVILLTASASSSESKLEHTLSEPPGRSKSLQKDVAEVLRPSSKLIDRTKVLGLISSSAYHFLHVYICHYFFFH